MGMTKRPGRKTPDLSLRIGKVRFQNPVWVASGTFGHAKEFEKFVDLGKLGALVTKTVTLKPRLGNPPQRIVETPSGMLNAIGLQNPGVEAFVSEKLPLFKKWGVPVLVSVMGYSVEELTGVVERLERESGIDGYELNLSCPNVPYGASAGGEGVKMFAHDETLVAQAVSAVRAKTSRVLAAKLGPDVPDIARMALAAERAGADAVALINTFMAMAIDIETRRPFLANRTGGLSGPCVRPIAVRMVWEAARKLRVPVVGIGGVMNGRDAVELMIAGAAAVQVGTASFINPAASMEVLRGITEYLRRKKIKTVQELTGSVLA